MALALPVVTAFLTPWRLLAVAVVAVAVWWFFAPDPATRPLTPAAIARLEPEMCSWGLGLTRVLTTIVPLNVGSPTRSTAVEQIALIDQYKGTGRRLVWVMRMPAAYIVHRTCDSGAQNWTGRGGNDLSVGQHYQLGLFLLDDRIVAATLATPEERDAGIAVVVHMTNTATDPAARYRFNAQRDWVIGRVNGTKDTPRCAEAPSDLPGLVTFRRADPAVKHVGMDCEGQFYRNGVFARKAGTGGYDIIIGCAVRCRMYADHEGWNMEYSFDRKHLAAAPSMHERVAKFVAAHTLHIERGQIKDR